MWLFVPAPRRDIFKRHIFPAVYLHRGEGQQPRSRVPDFLDGVKKDSVLARKIKVQRLRWLYEVGDAFDLVARELCLLCCGGLLAFGPGAFRTALPEFTSLQEF